MVFIKYILSLAITATLIILIGKRFLKPMFYLDKLWYIDALLLLVSILTAFIINIDRYPIITGITTGIIGGIIDLLITKQV